MSSQSLQQISSPQGWFFYHITHCLYNTILSNHNSRLLIHVGKDWKYVTISVLSLSPYANIQEIVFQGNVNKIHFKQNLLSETTVILVRICNYLFIKWTGLLIIEVSSFYIMLFVNLYNSTHHVIFIERIDSFFNK